MSASYRVASPLLYGRGMRKHLLTTAFALTVSLTGALAGTARADLVSERVLLVPTASAACGTGTRGFSRIQQKPDGTEVAESGEFQVPSGYTLEITSVDYTLPYYTKSAGMFWQGIDLYIRKRTNSYGGTSVLSTRYMNHLTFGDNGGGNLVEVGQYVSPSADLRSVAFPVGPLMDQNARLCVATPNDFWTFQGSMRVRGRLISTSTPINVGGGGILLGP